MIALGGFALLRPWWLLALPVLFVALLLTRARSNALTGWQRAVDKPLLAAMIARGGVSGGGARALPAVLTACFVILALSGPAIRSLGGERFRNLDATLLVLDVSRNVAGGPQLRTVASAAHDVLDHAGTRQSGLILYAGDAYLASGLSDDASGIDPLLFALDESTVPDPGARPDRALGLARKVLREARILRGQVVLITEGSGLEVETARTEAAGLRADGHRLDVLSVSEGGTTDPQRAAALARVAAAGGGISEPAVAPDRVLAAASGQAIEHLGASAVVALTWQDLGRFLLLAAGVPLLLGFRRGGAAGGAA